MDYFILDTNVLLEYRFLKHIHWQDYTSSKDFGIIIAKTVLKELDKLKYLLHKKKRKRIYQILRYLDDIFENHVENKLNIKILENFLQKQN